MWSPQISYNEFEDNYTTRSNITKEQYNRWKVTLPCDCGENGCQGWAAISREPDSIHHHCQFNFPPISEYLKYRNSIEKSLIEGAGDGR